ncbi:MAG TPA: hypothetical protein VFG23_21775 [Polyangia bacterium]|nr:hypothetical protein [Polyangia bacterium]
MTIDGREPSRLVEDSDAEGGDGAWAVGLLRSVTPYRAPAGRKQRVKLSLGQSAPHRAPAFLRPAIVAGMLIGCGAFASAALGHWPAWIARAYDHWVTPALVVAAAPVAEARRHAHGLRIAEASPPAVPAVAIAAAEPPAIAPMVAPAPTREPSPLRAHHVLASPAAREGTSAVLEAMRALRLDHDPVRARVLLDRYLERHPGGALAEEALAMSIEAAVAHHDPDAAALGARYLRLYPSGPFHSLAGQTQR